MDEDSAMDGGEVTLPDAAIMDQNIDDLFGEAADSLAVEALGVPLPAVPLPAPLVLRMMERQSRGCCTKLAWSNTGSIAQLCNHGREIEFRSILRNPATGDWTLTEPSKSPIIAPEGTHFEHLQFSGIGIDLAATDNHGTVRVYTLVGALGNMILAPMNIVPTSSGQSDMDTVVGLHWLPTYPTQFRVPHVTPATKVGDGWVTELRNRTTSEQNAHNPADNRHALCFIQRGARLTLMSQNEAVWYATSIELETPSSSSELLSHASITENADHLLAVTHDVGRRFRLYKITIVWNATQHTRPAGPPYTTVAPNLQIERLTMLNHIAAQQADLACLSYLRLVPSTPTSIADPDTSSTPTVFAIFTRATGVLDPTQHQESFSIISRWHVESASPVLHESFAKMKPNSSTPSTASVTVLRRQEDVFTNKLLLGMTPQYYSMMLAFYSSDASTDFRDRATMAGIEPYGESTTVSSLPQTGFEHMMGHHNADIAMSPDGSTLAMKRLDGTLTYKPMTLRYSWQAREDGVGVTGDLVEAAIVCLARQYVILSCAQIASDDVLALLPQDLSPGLRALFIYEVIKMTNRTLDIALQEYAKQQVLAVKENLVRLAMSASYILNTVPGTPKPTWASKFAFAYLSTRTACTALAQLPALVRADNGVQTHHVLSLRGIARWCCDFFAYIVDGLVTLKRAIKPLSNGQSIPSPTSAFIDAVIEKESPVLNLLLSTFTRVFIRVTVVSLSRYFAVVQRSMPNARSVAERTELEATVAYLLTLPLKLQDIDALIADVDTSIRAVCSSPTNPISPARREELELHALTSPYPAPEHIPIVEHLLDTTIPNLAGKIDPAALYFRDTTWIGMEYAGEEARRRYDVVRKLPIPDGAKLRVCRRCGSVMEDATQEQMRGMSPWLIHAQRTCFCGCYWVVE